MKYEEEEQHYQIVNDGPGPNFNLRRKLIFSILSNVLIISFPEGPECPRQKRDVHSSSFIFCSFFIFIFSFIFIERFTATRIINWRRRKHLHTLQRWILKLADATRLMCDFISLKIKQNNGADQSSSHGKKIQCFYLFSIQLDKDWLSHLPKSAQIFNYCCLS